MKNKNLFNLCMGVMVLFFVLSCTKDQVIETTELEQNEQSESLTLEDAKRILSKVGYNVRDLSTTDMTIPGSTSPQKYFVAEGDIVFSEERLKNMKKNNHNGSNAKQYRTEFLVNVDGPSIRTVSIYAYVDPTGKDPRAFNATMQTAIQQAVNKYNELDLKIRFSVVYGPNIADAIADIKMANNRELPVLGRALVPNDDGNPGSTIVLNDQRIAAAVETRPLIASFTVLHELGHAIGMHHTNKDFDSTICGDVLPGSGGIHIPGTPTGSDILSVFNSCPLPLSIFMFSPNDIKALKELYGPKIEMACNGLPRFIAGWLATSEEEVDIFSNVGWTVRTTLNPPIPTATSINTISNDQTVPDWIRMTSPLEGSGDGIVKFRLTRNESLPCEGEQRVGYIVCESKEFNQVKVIQIIQIPRELGPHEECP